MKSIDRFGFVHFILPNSTVVVAIFTIAVVVTVSRNHEKGIQMEWRCGTQRKKEPKYRNYYY